MKRKLFCIIMALIMIMQCAPLAQAKDLTDSVTPGVDMEVKWSDSADFKNGPVTRKAETGKADFRTTLDMESVLGKFVEWYTRAESIINNITKLDTSLNKEELMNSLNSLVITGEFIVKIEYPKNIDIPDAFLNGGDMYGFNDEAKIIFKEEKGRHHDSASRTITITISVTDINNAEGKLTAGVLYANRDAYLADITLTAENIVLNGYGTYTAKGTLSGHTETKDFIIGSENFGLKVDYVAKQIEGKENNKDKDSISATAILAKKGNNSAPSSSGGVVQITDVLEFNIDGDTTTVKPIEGSQTVSPEQLPIPEKEGYTFDGWYHDAKHTDKVDEPITVSGKKVLYGHWMSDILDTEDHFAYVIGYPDGTVRPENNISREEVATIFYRLLREDSLISIATDSNTFTDVEADRWSNKAISSLANGGYINGYEDGSFRPANFITRAEFATMATRYAKLSGNDDINFTDIAGHWAEDYIEKAATAGWVTGYEDGTFGPEKYITRAEVMTIINRMLVRYVDEAGLHADAVHWIDMDGTEWYYYNVLEATNSHDYDRREDGKLENWTSINENKIWIELDEMENAD